MVIELDESRPRVKTITMTSSLREGFNEKSFWMGFNEH